MTARAARGISPAQFALGNAAISFAIALGANVGLSVVLERSGAGALPALLSINGIVLAAGTVAVVVLGRGAALRSLTASLVLGAVLVGVSELGAGSRARWSATVLYLVSTVLGDLCAALFWSLANEMFDPRSAKHVFPRVGAAGTAGAALAGVVARFAGNALGERGLVTLWVASLVIAAGWAVSIPRGATHPTRASLGPARTHVPAEREDRSLVGALALGFVVVISVTSVGRYLYSWSLSDAFGADAVGIAKLNGLLNAIASVATGVVQLFVTPLMLARWGIRATMLVYPAALIVLFGLLAIHPALAVGIALFFATSVVRRAVQGPVESVLPTGLLPEDASRTVLLLTAVGAPVGMLVTGAALGAGSSGRASITGVALLGIAIAAALAAAAWWRARAYAGALRVRLSKGGHDLRRRLLGSMAATHDVHTMLVDELDANDPDLVHRLETLVRARHDRDDAATGAWHADSPLAKIALARLAEAYRLHDALERLPERLREDEGGRWQGVHELWRGSIRHRIGEDVRAVILVMRAFTGQSELDRIARRISDADVRTRSVAVEILDALCPDEIRSLLVPLVEQAGRSAAMEEASRRFGAPPVDPIETLLEVPDDWVRACTAYALYWLDAGPYRARLTVLGDRRDAFLRVAIAHAAQADVSAT